MRRIVIIEEHPDGNSEKIRDRWQFGAPWSLFYQMVAAAKERCISSIPRLYNRDSARLRPPKLLSRQRHEDQHGDDRDQEAERARHAVPFLRLPHAEPLAADRHEADLPEQETKREPEHREGLGAIER